MYLKSLEIQGFKSFAEKTVLNFNPGLTSVVGPNGSGKSNIADAVRWVLGEQSAKTLRGSRMEDVIFSGTQHRKPVGFASVSLVIDNFDRALPIDFSEVTISRRMYRSGESEYAINKTPCRLKDINELFMNTGAGREGYSIIGQGRIDEILSARSEERRLVFEEAAGITKYKARKKEAERKLENTRQNLLRINDIIMELESQLEPLAQQAETARRFIDLSNELKGIEVSMFLDTIDRLKNRIAEVENQAAGLKEQIDEENSKIENIRCRNRSKNESLERLKAEAGKIRESIYALDSGIEKNESNIRIFEEKISHLQSNIEGFGEDIRSIRERMAALETEAERKEKRIQQLTGDSERFARLLAEAEQQLAEIMAKLDESERIIEEAKQSVMDKQDQLSDSRIRANNLRNDLENYKQLRGRLSEDIRQALLDKDRENMEKEDMEASLRKTRDEIAATKDTVNSLEEQRNGIVGRLESLRGKRDAVARDLQSLESRRKVLLDMEATMEGYSHSVKSVMNACRENREFGKGIYGALAQLINVKEEYETAVEVCLGGALQNIVTEDEYAAKRAIEFLKRNSLGRATFLPISSVKPRTLEPEVLGQVRGMPGFEGIAADMVSCSSRFRGIILNLLGRTVIVDNMDSAIKMARQFGYSFRIVTRDGEVLNTGGSITGGSESSRLSSLISRHRVIKELESKIRAVGKRQKELDEEIAAVEQESRQITEQLEANRKTLSDLELVRLRDESHVARLLENIKRLAARAEMLKQQEEEIEGNILKIEGEIAQEAENTHRIEAEIQELKDLIRSQQVKNKDEQDKRNLLHTDINDYRVSINSIAESIQNLKEQLEQLKEEQGSITGSLEKREADRKRNLERIEELKVSIAGVQEKIRGMKEEKTGLELKAEGIAEEIRVLEEELSGMLDAVTSYNNTIMTLQDGLGRLEARKAKMEAELETIQNRLWDEYGLTYGNAEPLRQEISNVKATQARITELKEEIRSLGPVNVAAIEDYARTKERCTFMITQRDDLVKSEEKLCRVIQDITRVMKKQFIEQFALINRNFNIVFRELFDGGHAEVQLADEENVLESNIDIIVQPPGKKLQNMLLLSGGEKAMVAIALIFGILRMRPAPFYILDEIEASLDEANVYKFAEYIRRYTDKAQFIIITHRKGTMEAADTLYGVTMQEYGVSKVVSLRLGEGLERNAG
ncbi:MAG TPA: chromosome segregation protein SMC [Thermoclostridium sp.]|nr:chromosome segregation protein SMC [Thermoclostridium sp.]HPU45539.1 chromosome segregation protein SMC [Thermoclostridium sp.]